MTNEIHEDDLVVVGEAPVGVAEIIPAPSSPRGSVDLTVKHQDQEKEVDIGSTTAISPTTTLESEVFQSPISPTVDQAALQKTTTADSNEISLGVRSPQRETIGTLWRASSQTVTNGDATTEDDPTGEKSDDAPSSASQSDAPPVELPAAPVAKHEEPRSFFDTDFDSEGDGIIRTASRASSVQDQRPKLVQLHATASFQRQQRYYQPTMRGHPYNPGPSRRKAEQILGTRISSLFELTPAGETPNPLARYPDPPDLNKLYVPVHTSVDEASTTALAPTPPSSSGSNGSSPEEKSAPLAGSAFGRDYTLSPMSKRFSLSPLDALRSNPVDSLLKASLQRTASAPPLPLRRPRKVTIAPVDMDAVHSASEKRLFRDSIVSTPFPGHSMSTPEDNLPDISTIAHVTPPEILVLELSLAKHPLSSKLLTIPIYNRGSFDDKALFTSLRHTYNNDLLTPVKRYLTARNLSGVSLSFTSPSTVPNDLFSANPAPPFDPVDFVKHLQHPQSGHRRKTWLQWLRRQQPHHHANQQRRRSSTPHSQGPHPGTRTFYPTPPDSTSTNAPAPIPQITLHHSFSIPRIAMAVALVVYLTIIAVLFWVLFGVPGARAGSSKGNWKIDAEKRVLTGLVLGVFVLGLGGSGVGAWVAASAASL